MFIMFLQPKCELSEDFCTVFFPKWSRWWQAGRSSEVGSARESILLSQGFIEICDGQQLDYIYIGFYNTNYIYIYALYNPIIQVLTRHIYIYICDTIYDTNPIIVPDGHTNIFRGSYRFLHPLEGIPNDCRMTIPHTLVYHVLTMAHLMMLIC